MDEAKKNTGNRHAVARDLKVAKRQMDSTKTEYLVWFNIFNVSRFPSNVSFLFSYDGHRFNAFFLIFSFCFILSTPRLTCLAIVSEQLDKF